MADNLPKTQKGLDRINRLTAIGAAAGTLGELSLAFSATQSSALRASILQQNAAAQRLAAETEREAAAADANLIQSETSKRIASQRAALAANGIVVDQDSALDLVQETRGVGTLDALRALENGERRAQRMLRSASVNETDAQLESSLGTSRAITSVGRAFNVAARGFGQIDRRNQRFRLPGGDE